MDRKCYTIILVPHTRARFRKIQVTTVQLWGSLTVALALAATAGVLGWLYFTAPVDERQVARLHGENDELRSVNQSFEVTLRQLQTQLAEYEERTRKLAIVAGIEELEAGGDAGLGGARGGDLAEMERRSAHLDRNLDGVERRLEERMRWISSTPTVSPTRGLLTSGFGMRRDPVDGRAAFHQGLDISAPAGKAVYATADGVVVRAGTYGELGNAVVLSHGFGLTTRYGHLSRVTALPGQRVQRGEVIGYVGNSGRSTGYHLHYEVLEDGEPVNPLAYILDRPLGG